jgi:hypothetical protein
VVALTPSGALDPSFGSGGGVTTEFADGFYEPFVVEWHQ